MAGKPTGIEGGVLAAEPLHRCLRLRLGNLGFDICGISGRCVFSGGCGADFLPGLVLIFVYGLDCLAHQVQLIELHFGKFLHFLCRFHALRLQPALHVVSLLLKVIRGGILQRLVALFEPLQILLLAAGGQHSFLKYLLKSESDGLISIVVAGVPAVCLPKCLSGKLGCVFELVVKQLLRGLLGDKAVLCRVGAAENHHAVPQCICHRLAEVIVVGLAVAIGLAEAPGCAADKAIVLQQLFGGIFGCLILTELKHTGIGIQAPQAVASLPPMRLIVGVQLFHRPILLCGAIALLKNGIPAILFRDIESIAEQSIVIDSRFIHVKMDQLLGVHILIQGIGNHVHGVEGNGKVGGIIRLLV